MPILLNQHQPPRPTIDPDTKKRLMYRTYPLMKDSGAKQGFIYRTTDPMNRICQLMLYRWSRSDDFVEAPSCRDLYNFLIAERKLPPSIRAFGQTIINALDYECRKLKGVSKSNDKMRQIYFFESRYELQYGLEYMICAWLRNFLNASLAPGAAPISGPEEVAEELDILCTTPSKDFAEVYIEPLFDADFMRRTGQKEPDWRALLRGKVADADSEFEKRLEMPEPLTRLKNFS